MVTLVPHNSEFTLSPTLYINELVLERQKNGENIHHMGFGESPFPIPPRLVKSLKNAANRKEYLPCAGLPQLCDKVKSYYAERTNLDVDAYDVIVATRQ